MIWLLLGIMAVIATVHWVMKDDTTCPLCKEDTVEVGYEGYKRKCLHCGWDNSDSEVLHDDFLDKP
jgi:ribosomal protein L37AE/L43A